MQTMANLVGQRFDRLARTCVAGTTTCMGANQIAQRCVDAIEFGKPPIRLREFLRQPGDAPVLRRR